MSNVLASAAGAPTVVGEPTVHVVDRPALHVNSAERLLPLDGWRALSILAVLACHMLPLGPHAWQLNEAAGILGMSIFFTLSGFLITTMLLRRLDVRAFFIRRACRILPLVLLYATAALLFLGAPAITFLAHYLFTINYWHDHLTDLTAHLWSICVEIHFYVFIGLLCLFFRRRAFWMIPFICLAITAIRIIQHNTVSIETHLRVDEILSGACLALIFANFALVPLRRVLAMPMVQPLFALFLLFSCHPDAGPMNYLRPYMAAGLVGSTLFQQNTLQRFLITRPLAYIAAISYALYIFHPATYYGWLGSGDTLVKYAKRPLSFALAFALAHFSTFYYEKFWIAQGKKWSADKRREVQTQPV